MDAMDYIIIVVSFIFCAVFAAFSTWDYFDTKKKEDEGREFATPSKALIGPMVFIYFCIIITFLMLIGVIKVK